MLRLERYCMHARSPVLVAQQCGHFLAGEIENLERHLLRWRLRKGDSISRLPFYAGFVTLLPIDRKNQTGSFK